MRHRRAALAKIPSAITPAVSTSTRLSNPTNQSTVRAARNTTVVRATVTLRSARVCEGADESSR